MRSRSRGKRYSTTMDNENKMKMKKTKTTTMMENNANENDQRKKEAEGRRRGGKGIRRNLQSNNRGLPKQSRVFSAAAAAARRRNNQAVVVQPEDVSLLAILRCIAFTLWTFSLAVPLFLTMCVIFPFCYFLDRTRRYALSFVNDRVGDMLDDAVCEKSPSRVENIYRNKTNRRYTSRITRRLWIFSVCFT